MRRDNRDPYHDQNNNHNVMVRGTGRGRGRFNGTNDRGAAAPPRVGRGRSKIDNRPAWMTSSDSNSNSNSSSLSRPNKNINNNNNNSSNRPSSVQYDKIAKDDDDSSTAPKSQPVNNNAGNNTTVSAEPAAKKHMTKRIVTSHYKNEHGAPTNTDNNNNNNEDVPRLSSVGEAEAVAIRMANETNELKQLELLANKFDNDGNINMNMHMNINGILQDDEQEQARQMADGRRKRKLAIMKKFSATADSGNDKNNEIAIAANTVTNNHDDSVVEAKTRTRQVQEHMNIEARKHPPKSTSTAEVVVYVESPEQRQEQEAAELSDDYSEDSFDMFAGGDDDDDVDGGGEKSSAYKTTKRKKHTGASSTHAMMPAHKGANTTDADAANWDDSEGYYKATIGEIISLSESSSASESYPAASFRVLGVIGKGVFSSVLKCCDVIEPGRIVAVKLIRSNETMAKAAQKELRILKILASSKEGNTHCVRLLSGSGFEHRNHITMYFEIMHMNLRETVCSVSVFV